MVAVAGFVVLSVIVVDPGVTEHLATVPTCQPLHLTEAVVVEKAVLILTVLPVYGLSTMAASEALKMQVVGSDSNELVGQCLSANIALLNIGRRGGGCTGQVRQFCE
uniref:Uncharacterized protein n=1 Tax=uncultured verrucomicrobium HF0500_27H16 TaxID=723600 RepID=E7C5J7_9BACT|nr:hypothetical protein [uncultured verrucomicrobium HF0500_27H16]